MSRGRKPTILNHSDWEYVFYNSVGTYVQYMNIKLANKFKSEALSKHIRIIGGYAFKSSDYKKQGVPVIRISDFNNEQIILQDVVYYEEAKELEKYKLGEGDIIIALTGGTIAKLAIVQGGLGKLYLNQRVGKFEVLNPAEFESEYVYWIARSVQSIIKNLAWGAAIPNVSPKQIEELEFPIPDKKVQKGIIGFLNALKNNSIEAGEEYFNKEIEDEIYSLQLIQVSGYEHKAELTHQLDLVKQLRQAFLREAMQGKLVEPTHDGETGQQLLAKIKAEKAQLIAAKKLKKEKDLPPIKPEDIPFEIPKHWTWCRLGEIVEMSRGRFSIRPRNDPSYFGGKYPFIQIGSLDEFGSFITEAPQTLNEKGYKVSKEFPKHTIVIAIVGGTIGNLGVLGIPMCFTDSMVGIFPSTTHNQTFILNYLRFVQPVIKQAAYQMAGQPNIKIPTLTELLLPLPPLSEQQRIVEKMESLMQTCDALETSIKASQGQNQQLLQQVLREALRKEVVN